MTAAVPAKSSACPDEGILLLLPCRGFESLAHPFTGGILPTELVLLCNASLAYAGISLPPEQLKDGVTRMWHRVSLRAWTAAGKGEFHKGAFSMVSYADVPFSSKKVIGVDLNPLVS